ncbi:hypothetical protein [Rhizobium sp. AAP43]|uniref:hypothetical protein n=1 Tax=Rhizobium sp. AAP43 TaxID=1523420 RepID=UPI0006B9C4BC|nr:hypothetical protein [Rhizobium sp. AAP43]
MPSSTLTKYQDFSEQLARGVHNFGAHTIKVAFTNTTPNVATHTVLADIGQIATGGGYTGGAGGGLVLDTVIVSEAAGIVTIDAADEVFTASGGSVGPIRYFVFYNDTPTSPADPLIGYIDYGASIVIGDGEAVAIPMPSGFLTIS